MTTILADAHLGVIVADSAVNDEDRVWTIKKVHRIRGHLVATAGELAQGRAFVDWYRAGADTPPNFKFDGTYALVLTPKGLFSFDESCLELTKVRSGREAIGTGGKGAICAYEALGWQDPVRAVKIACKHDLISRPPVRLYQLRTA